MGVIVPVTELPARNASVSGQVTALGSTVRFYGVLTSGAASLSLIQRFTSGDWDYVRYSNGNIAQVQVNPSGGQSVEYADVNNPNSGSIFALLASTPVPASLRAYIDDLVDPAAGEYTGPALSSTNPAQVGATLSYGSGSTAARTDHVHTLGADALLVGIPIGSGSASTGAFSTLSAATSLTLGAGANLAGTTGAGAVSLGSMTGACALPTGALSWAGGSSKALSLAATAASSITSSAALTITAGGASAWTTSAGALTITSAAAATWSTGAGALGIDAAAALNLGTAAATSVAIGRSGTLVVLASKLSYGAASQSVTDPGNAGAIAVTADGVCNITTAGAETRTLAIPTYVGQELMIGLDTDGGDCVITVASAINQTGNNTITLNDAGDNIFLKARTVGGTRRWSVVSNDGCTLSTV